MQWAQTFKASLSGVLSTLRFTTFKIGYPDATLQIAVYRADKTGKPTGSPLSTQNLDAGVVGWSAKRLTVRPKIKIEAGINYCVVVKSAAVTGSYGFAYQTAEATSVSAFYSGDGGNTYTADNSKIIKFDMLDSSGKQLNK